MTRRPLEFYTINTKAALDWPQILTNQDCPLLNRKCIKQRKSNSEQTIGACIVGYQEQPLIICPQRFLENKQIFLDTLNLVSTMCDTFYIVPEVTIPGGSIDYFLVGLKEETIIDFVGLEIQALDTTGSGGIWQAREDLLNAQLGDSYKYGINWKMSAKTILIQLHHKAETFELLGKKLVLILQEQFFNYIQREFNTDSIREEQATDSVHFHTYDCVEINQQLKLTLVQRLSTNTSGIERLLKLGKGAQLLEEDLISRINLKLPKAVRLDIQKS